MINSVPSQTALNLRAASPRMRITGLADADSVEFFPQTGPSPHVARFGTSTGVLAKLLDTAERLPVHVHPGRAFAREAFGSKFGKTEAWIVLDTRGDEAEVWVGLREAVETERYREWIADQDVDALLRSLNRISVRAGDVVYVPAGVPHAIGAGALIAELQEPTDFSFLCE